ncbi:MAG: bifunctional nuclease family protein [Flavobacteriales bacterium]|nr:bifunctional nuclease family protein [Flavobacteriales bacterium]MCX7767745.1 bifunctional nuclease family protein [Flavobacteriales bacterium]MDW8409360.1 bifunctional nuclease family protein [Flavobacteriales bacterium]
MKKVRLEVLGLSQSQIQESSFALVLGDEAGERRLPIIIGTFEAQAIALKLENLPTQRPLTHDLFRSMADAFGIRLVEVVINNLQEGIFYSVLVCEKDGERVEIDSRTSDAIALALRFNCPIYTYDFILASAGIAAQSLAAVHSEEQSEEEEIDEENIEKMSTSVLKEKLKEAVETENYEMASRIRDELKRRKALDT